MKNRVLLFFKKKVNKNIQGNFIINKIGFFGMDAVVIMSDFFDEFEIPNSEDFEIYSFFVEELSFIDFIKKGYKKRIKDKKDLTISHLIEVAECKKWFDPDSPAPASL